jgi:lipopolysaccharide/colanic/teichoic acid biosynthesis glycosyltransferase
MRRIGDVVIACALLAITLPLMLCAALAIRFEGPGPILDSVSCIGRGGRRFQMLRFRTMVHDAAGTLPNWARQPTQIGQFLRYSRIECLPQLINVLRGEISIVDPDGSSPSFFD